MFIVDEDEIYEINLNFTKKWERLAHELKRNRKDLYINWKEIGKAYACVADIVPGADRQTGRQNLRMCSRHHTGCKPPLPPPSTLPILTHV
jgi:hypothetical protein